MKTTLFAGGIIASSLGLGLAVDGQRPVLNPAVKPAGLQAHDSHAAASLIGQFRTSFASWMFLRTDLYLHNGVEMRPLSEVEVKAGHKGVGGTEKGGSGSLHDDSKIVTIVPEAKHDFRGVFGDVEREVKAFKDMKGHGHNDPKAALPLFRLMTWIDPQFTPGWSTGGIIISRERTDEGTRKALAFLKEGLENNPQNIDLLTQIGYIYTVRGRRLAEAIPYYDKARLVARENLERLSEEEREALRQTYRWLALCLRETGREPDMKAIAQEGLRLFPDDGILGGLLVPVPKILTEEGLKRYLKRETSKLEAEATVPEEDDHDHRNHEHHEGHDHVH